MGLRRFLLVLTLAIVLVLAVVVWFYPSSEDFRTENPFWNGLKAFSEQFQASTINSLDSLPAEPEGTSLVLVPYLELTESEMKKVRDYVSHGGTLILLDDYGYGNELLEYLGVDLRFTQGALLDPLFNYKNKRLPRVTDFGPVPVAEDVGSIVLNHATSLSGVLESEVVAWSSRFSFLDLNHNSVWDEDDEPKGPLPVAAALPVNKGYVVLVADPSILINSMEGMEDNYGFIESIIESQDLQPEVLVDQSHLPEANLDEAKGVLARIRSRLSSPLGISALTVVALIVVLSPLWRREGSS